MPFAILKEKMSHDGRPWKTESGYNEGAGRKEMREVSFITGVEVSRRRSAARFAR